MTSVTQEESPTLAFFLALLLINILLYNLFLKIVMEVKKALKCPSLRIEHQLDGHMERVWDVAWSPQGGWMV